MTREFPDERFNDENVAKAFAAIAAHTDYDLVRWALLRRYVEARQLLQHPDAGCMNRAWAKMEEIEWVLAQFGEPPYDGLPLADGTSGEGTALSGSAFGAEIGGGYPGGSGSRPPL